MIEIEERRPQNINIKHDVNISRNISSNANSKQNIRIKCSRKKVGSQTFLTDFSEFSCMRRQRMIRQRFWALLLCVMLGVLSSAWTGAWADENLSDNDQNSQEEIQDSILISQVLYDSTEELEAVELFNPSNDSIDMSSYIIKTSASSRDATIPNNTIFLPFSFYLIADTGWNQAVMNSSSMFFGQPAADYEEVITLKNSDSGVVLLDSSLLDNSLVNNSQGDNSQGDNSQDADSSQNVIDAVGWGNAPAELYLEQPAQPVEKNFTLLRTGLCDYLSEDFSLRNSSLRNSSLRKYSLRNYSSSIPDFRNSGSLHECILEQDSEQGENASDNSSEASAPAEDDLLFESKEMNNTSDNPAEMTDAVIENNSSQYNDSQYNDSQYTYSGNVKYETDESRNAEELCSTSPSNISDSYPDTTGTFYAAIEIEDKYSVPGIQIAPLLGSQRNIIWNASVCNTTVSGEIVLYFNASPGNYSFNFSAASVEFIVPFEILGIAAYELSAKEIRLINRKAGKHALDFSISNIGNTPLNFTLGLTEGLEGVLHPSKKFLKKSGIPLPTSFQVPVGMMQNYSIVFVANDDMEPGMYEDYIFLTADAE